LKPLAAIVHSNHEHTQQSTNPTTFEIDPALDADKDVVGAGNPVEGMR